jgi:hypothetical protein
MSKPTRDLSGAAWWHILWSNGLGPASITAFIWGCYVAAAVYDFDVFDFVKRRQQRPDPMRAEIYLSVAILFTAGALARAVYTISRAVKLARHGVEVVATITKVGSINMKGYVRVHYEYWLNGVRVQQVMSCPRFLADEYEDGTRELVLVCDARRPQRSMEKDNVWRDAPSEEEQQPE